MVIVGAGIFGLTAALELDRRRYRVIVVEAGPVPHPLAASTDLSKVVRIEYGPDETYARLAERARRGWLDWNQSLFSSPLYHEIGATFLTREPMQPGSYEYENYRMLRARGHRPERLTPAEIRARLPAWNADRYVDGYFNSEAGYVESGAVVDRLVRIAIERGIEIVLDRPVEAVVRRSGRTEGVHFANGDRLLADQVIIATGAWTPLLLPELSSVLRPVGQPVFHLRPHNPELFAPPNFFVFGADSSHTGWYGFPVHPTAGVVKIANHGPGWPVHPGNDRRVVSEDAFQRLRVFLADTFPSLADAPIVGTRCCLYCDTPDEHFWIAAHPECAGLVVATGDSGHAFKFAPLLGGLIADAVEHRPNDDLERFRWRDFAGAAVGQEASRYRGEPQAAGTGDGKC